MAAALPASALGVGQPAPALAARDGAWLVAGLWVYVAFGLVWFTQSFGSPHARELVATWSPLPGEILALGLLLPLLKQKQPGFRRSAWVLLTIAVVADISATFWWAVFYAPPTPASMLWLDTPYFLYYPLSAAAMLLFYRDLGGPLRGRALCLDAATLALGFGATLWLCVLRPQIEVLGWGSPDLYNLIAFCAGNGILMVVTSLMITRVVYWRADAAVLLVAGAIFCAFTTDLKWLDAGAGYFIFDAWSNIGGYGLFYALLGTGAFLERHWRVPAGARIVGGNRYSVLPILSVLVAVGMLYGARVQSRGLEWMVLVAFAIAGVLLVVARQQGISNEITRLGAALARRDAQAHLTELIRRSADGVAVIDAEGMPVFISPASERLLGVPAAELMSRPAASMLGAEHEQRMRAFLELLVSAPRRRADMELIVGCAHGERRALQILGVNQLENRIIAGITLTIRDVTARRRLEREVLEIALLERERLAAEIRGALGAGLLQIKRCIGELREAARADADYRAQAAAAVAQVNRNIDTARRLSMTLSPLHVARGALDVALRSLCGDQAQRFGVRIDFRSNLGSRAVAGRESEHVYRIAQDILEYAVQSRSAGHLDLGLYCETESLQLRLLDTERSMPRAESRDPVGLRLAEYRAHVLGGTLRRQSTPEGLRIDVTVPLTV